MLYAVALVILAQAKAPAPTVQTKEYVDRGQGDARVVAFDDDPLAGNGIATTGVTIRPLPGAVRVGLIRPRTTFVPELLKSVENL